MFRIGKIVSRRFSSASLNPKEFGISDDYEVLSSLGKGSSARVFMGVNLLTKQKVVIKMFKQLPVNSIQKEISINLKLLSGFKPTLKHVEFIQLLDTLYDYPSSTFTLIYQFFPGVTLK
jgi:casein kinase II subunit alpha